MKQNRRFYPGRLRFACSEIIFIYFIFYILLFRKHCKLKSIKYVTMAKRVIDYVNFPSLKKIDHDFLIGLDSNRLYISVLIIKKKSEISNRSKFDTWYSKTIISVIRYPFLFFLKKLRNHHTNPSQHEVDSTYNNVILSYFNEKLWLQSRTWRKHIIFLSPLWISGWREYTH